MVHYYTNIKICKLNAEEYIHIKLPTIYIGILRRISYFQRFQQYENMLYTSDNHIS